jgi:hypothetical protein
VIHEHLRQAKEEMATVHQIAAQTLGFARMLPTVQEVDLIELAEAALRIHHAASLLKRFTSYATFQKKRSPRFIRERFCKLFPIS